MQVENIYIYHSIFDKKFTSNATITVEGFGKITIQECIPQEIIESACNAAIMKLRTQFKLETNELNKENKEEESEPYLEDEVKIN